VDAFTGFSVRRLNSTDVGVETGAGAGACAGAGAGAGTGAGAGAGAAAGAGAGVGAGAQRAWVALVAADIASGSYIYFYLLR